MCLSLKVVGLVPISSRHNEVEGSEDTEDAEAEVGGLAEVKYCNFLFQVNFKNNNKNKNNKNNNTCMLIAELRTRAWAEPHS